MKNTRPKPDADTRAHKSRAPSSSQLNQPSQSNKPNQPRQSVKPDKSATRNLWLVIFEHAMSEGMVAMSVLTLFWTSAVGLNYAEITLSQAIYTVALLLLDIPMGYLADRFSRKWANVVGDLGLALFHFYYATATNFFMVVTAEIGLGIFCSLTSGVDASLLSHFVKKAGGDERTYEKAHARMMFYGNAVALPLVLLGGPIGAISLRLAMFVSGVPRLLAGIASLFIEDDSEKLEKREQNAFSDMLRVARDSLKKPELLNRILVYAVLHEMSHPIIWILTPILILAGVPMAIVSVAWALDSITRGLGSMLAEKWAPQCNTITTALIPFVALTVSTLTLTISISPFTIGVYLLSGLAFGWVSATLIPLVQEKAPPAEQTTVISIAKTLARLLYIPVIYLVGLAADVSLNLACGVIAVIFIPLGLFVVSKLR